MKNIKILMLLVAFIFSSCQDDTFEEIMVENPPVEKEDKKFLVFSDSLLLDFTVLKERTNEKFALVEYKSCKLLFDTSYLYEEEWLTSIKTNIDYMESVFPEEFSSYLKEETFFIFTRDYGFLGNVWRELVTGHGVKNLLIMRMNPPVKWRFIHEIGHVWWKKALSSGEKIRELPELYMEGVLIWEDEFENIGLKPDEAEYYAEIIFTQYFRNPALLREKDPKGYEIAQKYNPQK